MDWDTEVDWEWRTAADDTPEQLMALWKETVARSRAAVADALAADGLDQRLQYSDWTEPPNLRRVIIDMIEEYARHVGHADLLRESVDGVVGEDPPEDFSVP